MDMPLTAAADGSHTSGAMIALIPTVEDAERLAIEGGEAADQLHLTLRYLGKGADFDEEARAAIVDAVSALAEGMPPITSKLFGAAHWNGNGDEPSWVWSVGDDPEHGPSLEAAHGMAEEALLMAPMDVELPAPHTPWVGHVCAAYSAELDLIIALEERLGPVTFDRVRVAFAGDHTDIPLGGDVAASARVLPSRWDEDVVHVEVETNHGGSMLLEAMRIATEGLAAELGVRVRVTGRTRTAARTAAADDPLRRQPTDMELASRVDFADMNQAWQDAVDDTVDAWAAIQTAQREEITAQVQAAVEADRLDQLDAIVVDTIPATNLLYGRMQAMALQAGEAQQREAEEQGIDVPPWSLDDEALTAAAIRERLRSIARVTATLLGGRLVQSAARRAVGLFGAGLSGQQVAAQVGDHLDGLSVAPVQEQVGAAVSAAQNEGRMAVLAVAPEASYFASEILDQSTCQPCRDVDGSRYDTLTAARAAYPAGGYTSCLGGTRCRGTIVTVWDQAADGREAAGEITLAAGATMRDDNEQGGTVPYSIVQDHPDCAASEPWGVTKDATGELMGCHSTEADAEEQRSALYAAEGDDRKEESSGDIYGMEIGALAPDGLTAPIRGPLVVEGIETGDGREFAPEVLTWDEPPLPLRWNKEDSHGGEPHTVAVNVGRMDKIWREGKTIMFEGVLNLAEEDGRRIRDMIKGKFIRGISIDADSIADADVEFVWPDDVNDGMDDQPEGDVLEMLFAQPEKVIYHGGRIRAATIVDIPAFAEAYVELLDEDGSVIAGGQRLSSDELQALRTKQFGAVAAHDTGTSDEPWDSDANVARLDSPMPVARARNMYAWIDDDRIEDGMIVKDACKFPHHNVGEDGTPGAANLAACSASIGALHGARGTMPDIPESDRRGVYDHVAAHLRDGGREPEPFRSRPALTAGAMDLWSPPSAWFKNPEWGAYTGITVTDQGQISGRAAQWDDFHIGFDGVPVKPPREESFDYFATGEVKCADGSIVPIGQITVSAGHASLGMGAAPAAEHYDNTAAAVADVAIGADKYGIWVAGAVRPQADPLSVYELRASGKVSGDWRRIGGKLRLVALLGVNVAGFPGNPKPRALVSGGQVMALVSAGVPSGQWGTSSRDLERWAFRIVMGVLRDRVHGGR